MSRPKVYYYFYKIRRLQVLLLIDAISLLLFYIIFENDYYILTSTLLFLGNASEHTRYTTAPIPVKKSDTPKIILTIKGSILKYSAIPPQTPSTT